MTLPPREVVPDTVRYSRDVVAPTLLPNTALPVIAADCCSAVVPLSVLENVTVEPVKVVSVVNVAAPV